VLITALLAGAGVALADRRRGSLIIVGALSLNQVALHLFLQLTGSHQDGMPYAGMPFAPTTMLCGHAAAAVLTGLMLARAEHALFVVARFLGLILPRKSSPLPAVAPLRTVRIRKDTVRVTAQLIHPRIHAPRGPPHIS
jgi:hypothetical protein